MAFTDSPKKNTYLRIENKLFYVIDRALKTQGRQGGLVILKLKSLDGGYNSEMTLKSGSKVEEVELQTKAVQYLYKDETSAYFMDTDSYETVSISLSMLDDYIYFLKEGESTLVLEFEGRIVDIRRKPTVSLKVTSAPDAVKGNTATNATKPIVVETGYELQAPLFIHEGDVIVINTDTGQYSGRSTN